MDMHFTALLICLIRGAVQYRHTWKHCYTDICNYTDILQQYTLHIIENFDKTPTSPEGFLQNSTSPGHLFKTKRLQKDVRSGIIYSKFGAF